MPAPQTHSFDEIEATLGAKEKYFQPLDKPVLEFTLPNADGGIVRLADFRGKVVVMHHLCQLPRRLSVARRADRRGPGHEQPGADEGAGSVHQRDPLAQYCDPRHLGLEA
jgi:hypothetical protein